MELICGSCMTVHRFKFVLLLLCTFFFLLLFPDYYKNKTDCFRSSSVSHMYMCWRIRHWITEAYTGFFVPQCVWENAFMRNRHDTDASYNLYVLPFHFFLIYLYYQLVVSSHSFSIIFIWNLLLFLFCIVNKVLIDILFL